MLKEEVFVASNSVITKSIENNLLHYVNEFSSLKEEHLNEIR